MLWLKAFHLITMVTWFGGLFYLPRLFVYHADSTDTISIERFKIMEGRLFYFIMTPSAVLTLILGIGMMHLNPAYYLHAGWLHAKLSLIAGLVVYHILCGVWLQQFKHNTNQHTVRFYRKINEVPVIFLVFIVLLAVFKPF